MSAINNRLKTLETQLVERYGPVYDCFTETLTDQELTRLIEVKEFELGKLLIEPDQAPALDWKIEVKLCAAFARVWGSYPKGYLQTVEAAEQEAGIVPGQGDSMLNR